MTRLTKHWTLLDTAAQYLGQKEVPGSKSNPLILAMLKLDAKWPTDDAVPWCSGFVNFIAFQHGMERSAGNLALRARSWLRVGKEVKLPEAKSGDVVVLKRGRGRQPGPEVINAPGHVAFYVSHGIDTITVLGGNQGDKVSVRTYKRSNLLGVRRLGRDPFAGYHG